MFHESNDPREQGSEEESVSSRSSQQESTRKSARLGNQVPIGQMRCSKCGQYFEKSASKVLPFCSTRCQQIDLGMWLNESYGLPYEGDESDVHRGDEMDE